jgi:hypothetical protein
MTTKQAALISIGMTLLVLIVVVIQGQNKRTPETVVVERQTVETVGPVKLYAKVNGLVDFAQRLQKGIQMMAAEVALAELSPADDVVEPVKVEPVKVEPKTAEWWETGRITLVFHAANNSIAIAEANRLHRAGEKVYRVPTSRAELYAQFKVKMVPTYLVLQDGKEVSRRGGSPCEPEPEAEPKTTCDTDAKVCP